MSQFKVIQPNDNPNEGRNKINYNFSIIEMSGGTSGGTVAGNNTEIQFNDGGYFGAVPYFTFDKQYGNFVVGANIYTSEIVNNTCGASIVGGAKNIIYNFSDGSSIIGGFSNYLGNNSILASIIGGESNFLVNYSTHSSIVGGKGHFLTNYSVEVKK